PGPVNRTADRGLSRPCGRKSGGRTYGYYGSRRTFLECGTCRRDSGRDERQEEQRARAGEKTDGPAWISLASCVGKAARWGPIAEDPSRAVYRCQAGTMFSACGPFWPWVMSKATFWPSDRKSTRL